MTASLIWTLLACAPNGTPETPTTSTTGPTTAGTTPTTTSSTTSTTTLDGRVVFGGPEVCANPLPSVTYTDVAASYGLPGSDDPDGPHGDGGSVAIRDLDRDGHLDLVFAYVNSPVMVLWNDGASFERQDLNGVLDPIRLAVADLDGNGWEDLVVAANGPPGAFLHDGARGFTRQTLPEFEFQTQVKDLLPTDLDGDGCTDLYGLVTGGASDQESKRDVWWWGNGDGTFQLDRERTGDLSAGHGFDAMWFDLDLDADLDLYVVNDLGERYGANQLLLNDGGWLVNVTDQYQVGIAHGGMGVDAADFSGDGLPDLYLTDATNNVLLESYGEFYVDVSRARNAALESDKGEMSWGAMFLDWDNDGDLDILDAQGNYEVVGEQDQVAGPLDIALLDNRGDTFVEVGPELGLAQEGSHRSLAPYDWNRDGVLDLLVTDVAAPPRWYMSDGCTASAWLEVQAPDGARVELTVGERTIVDWVYRDASMGGVIPDALHVGLGTVTQVDRLRVVLLGGEEIRWDEPFAVNQRVVIDLSREP